MDHIGRDPRRHGLGRGDRPEGRPRRRLEQLVASQALLNAHPVRYGSSPIPATSSRTTSTPRPRRPYARIPPRCSEDSGRSGSSRSANLAIVLLLHELRQRIGRGRHQDVRRLPHPEPRRRRRAVRRLRAKDSHAGSVRIRSRPRHPGPRPRHRERSPATPLHGPPGNPTRSTSETGRSPGRPTTDTYSLSFGPKDNGTIDADAAYFDTMISPVNSPYPGIVDCVKPIKPAVRRTSGHAAVAAMNRGSRRAAPPRAPRLATRPDEPRKIRAGCERQRGGGGIRTPQVEAPIATLSGLGQSGTGFCFLFGTTAPFDAAKLAALYPSHAAFVKAWNTATDQRGQGRVPPRRRRQEHQGRRRPVHRRRLLRSQVASVDRDIRGQVTQPRIGGAYGRRRWPCRGRRRGSCGCRPGRRRCRTPR